MWSLRLETEWCGFDLSREVAFRHYLIALPRQHKGRVCMMPGFTEEMKGAVSIDYSELAKRCDSLEKALLDKTVRITTELGTYVEFGLQGRKFVKNNGDLSRPGLYGNIPAGEVYTAPVEETMNGILVIDGSVGSLGMVDSPFSMEIEAGRSSGCRPWATPQRCSTSSERSASTILLPPKLWASLGLAQTPLPGS
jgi:leucyl aminopeptidase (aminopeptidase T)